MEEPGASRTNNFAAFLFANRILFALFLNCALLALSWHSGQTAFLVFLAFVPVFYLTDHPPATYNERLAAILLIFLGMFTWVYLALSWIRPVSNISLLTIAFLSGIVLSLPFVLTYFYRVRMGRSHLRSSAGFVSAWLLLELLHDFNILGLPYLNLGHIPGAYPVLIQWYAFGGSLLGTLWIFAVNYAIYRLLSQVVPGRRRGRVSLRTSAPAVLVLVLPPLVSVLQFNRPVADKQTDIDVLAVHTAVDVFEYKYRVDPDVLLDGYLATTLRHLDTGATSVVFWPENAITGDIFLEDIDSSRAVRQIKNRLCNDPGIALITGAIMDEVVPPPPPDAYLPNLQYNEEEGYYFKHYNAALLIQSGRPTMIKTKKRLVPFSEKVPTQKILAPLVRLLPNLADLNFSSREEGYPVFAFPGDSVRTTPVICYGSAFSSFFARETRQTGSNYLSVILNAGWMKSDKAYRHFKWLCTCRAIENRQFLVKSSNEGITGLISSRGEVLDALSGTGHGVVSGKLRIAGRQSFYTRHHVLVIILLVAGILAVNAGTLLVRKIPYKKHHNP